MTFTNGSRDIHRRKKETTVVKKAPGPGCSTNNNIVDLADIRGCTTTSRHAQTSAPEQQQTSLIFNDMLTTKEKLEQENEGLREDLAEAHMLIKYLKLKMKNKEKRKLGRKQCMRFDEKVKKIVASNPSAAKSLLPPTQPPASGGLLKNSMSRFFNGSKEGATGPLKHKFRRLLTSSRRGGGAFRNPVAPLKQSTTTLKLEPPVREIEVPQQQQQQYASVDRPCHHQYDNHNHGTPPPPVAQLPVPSQVHIPTTTTSSTSTQDSANTNTAHAPYYKSSNESSSSINQKLLDQITQIIIDDDNYCKTNNNNSGNGGYYTTTTKSPTPTADDNITDDTTTTNSSSHVSPTSSMWEIRRS